MALVMNKRIVSAMVLLMVFTAPAGSAPVPITFESPDYTAGSLNAASDATQIDKPFTAQGGWSLSTSTANTAGTVVATATSGEYTGGQGVSTSANTIIVGKNGYQLMDPATRIFTFDMRWSSTFSFGFWDDTDGDGLFDQAEAQLMFGVIDSSPKNFGMRGPGFGSNHNSGVAGTSGNWYRWVVHTGVPDLDGNRVMTIRVRNLTAFADIDFDSTQPGTQPWVVTLSKSQFGAEPEECDGMTLRITFSGIIDNINGPVPAAQGPEVYWSGAGADANWSTVPNWQNDTPPAAGKQPVFPFTDFPASLNDLPAGTSLGGITFTTNATNAYTLTGNSIVLDGTLLSTAPSTVHTVALPVTLPASRNAFISGTGAAVDATGVWSGPGGLNKFGSGTLHLRAANTFAGPLAVNGGTVRLYGDQTGLTGGFSSAEGGLLVVESGASAGVAAAAQVRIGSASATVAGLTVDGTLTNNGTLYGGRGATIAVTGTLVQHGPFTLESVGGSTSRLTVNAGGVLAYDGPAPIGMKSSTGTAGYVRTVISGRLETSRGLEETSTGTNRSTLQLTQGGEIRLTAAVPVLSSAVAMELFTGGGVIDTGAFDTEISASLTGAGSLTKRGTGRLSLTGTRTSSGDTLVEGGSLSVSSASFANAADVKLSAGTTLQLDFTGADTVDELLIAGVAQAIGEWGAIGSGAPNTTAAINGTGRLLVTTGPAAPDAFTAWISSFPALTSAAGKEKSADPDGDGWNNLAEFAFAADPSAAGVVPRFFPAAEDTNSDNAPEALLVIAVRTGAVFTGTPAPSASVDGITYAVQGALSPADFGGAGAPAVTPLGIWTGQPAPAGWQWQRFRLEGSAGLPGKGFLRAKVTAP